MESIIARVSNPAIPKGRVSCFKQVTSEDEGVTKGVCDACNTELFFIDVSRRAGEEIERVACSSECAKDAGFYPSPQKYIPPVQVEIKREEKKIEHVVEPVVKEKVAKVERKCSHCGGPTNRGRGFQHTNDCEWARRNDLLKAAREKISKALSIQQPNCPICGGGRNKRGYAHADDCDVKIDLTK